MSTKLRMKRYPSIVTIRQIIMRIRQPSIKSPKKATLTAGISSKRNISIRIEIKLLYSHSALIEAEATWLNPIKYKQQKQEINTKRTSPTISRHFILRFNLASCSWNSSTFLVSLRVLLHRAGGIRDKPTMSIGKMVKRTEYRATQKLARNPYQKKGGSYSSGLG